MDRHARKRMRERGIELHRVVEAIRDGEPSLGNSAGRVLYHLPANRSTNGRGLDVVLDTRFNKVITTFDRGRGR